MQSVNLQLTLGVDVQNNVPTFFLGTSSALSVNNISGSGSLSGTLDLGSLGSVSAAATATLTISQASLSFTNPHSDGKLRIGDFSTSSEPVAGSVQGSVSLGATLTANLMLLPGYSPSISWSPSFSDNVQRDWL